jgi:hypothetical protein
MNCFTARDRDVDMVVRRKPRSRRIGRIAVIGAYTRMSRAPFANGAKGCGTPNYNGKPKSRLQPWWSTAAVISFAVNNAGQNQ